ncbi:Integrase catalytic domain-containing protein [Camponotus japonicus]
MYSDCGTNFVGADKQLRALFAACSKEGRLIADQLASDRIQWRFNPPAAPHFGGLWEAAVKALKQHLRRVLGNATLTFEEMTTLLAQIEACLNSRPLEALTDDPEDITALTPGHFLIGTALNAVPEPSLLPLQENRLSRWQLVQRMRDHFWDRWSREYLHSLTHRPKWWKSNTTIRVGRLCLLRNQASPPNKWPLARIIRVHPGEDGHVRVVTVRTSTSELTRPVTQLIFLPLSDDCEDETESTRNQLAASSHN